MTAAGGGPRKIVPEAERLAGRLALRPPMAMSRATLSRETRALRATSTRPTPRRRRERARRTLRLGDGRLRTRRRARPQATPRSSTPAAAPAIGPRRSGADRRAAAAASAPRMRAAGGALDHRAVESETVALRGRHQAEARALPAAWARSAARACSTARARTSRGRTGAGRGGAGSSAGAGCPNIRSAPSSTARIRRLRPGARAACGAPKSGSARPATPSPREWWRSRGA